jgi:hypothetical protein
LIAHVEAGERSCQAEACVTGKGVRAALLLASLAAFAGAASAGTVRIDVPEAATTSAGIFDAEGRLVRTLWSGEPRERGAVALDWDGRNDDGAVVDPAHRYTARLLAHHVRYVWEGVIGNTSRDRDGAHVHRAFLPISAMAFDAAGDGFYAVGYNEGQPAMHRFRTSDPQRQDALGHDDYRRVFRHVATDGALVYFANEGLAAPRGSPLRDAETFVLAFEVSDGREHVFPAGRPAGTHLGTLWQSALDYDQDEAEFSGRFRAAPTGLAVQRRGDGLFVAHGGLDEIRVVDKRTGALLGRIPARDPGDMDTGPDGSLWVLCGAGAKAAVVHYRSSGSRWERAGELSEGLIDPVALAVSPVDGSIVVVDAGSEQLKAFDSAGRQLWVLGRAGGYRDGVPEVTADRFWFSAGPTYVAFEPDGSFWFGDAGNVRNLHYSSARRRLGEIMYLPHSYVVAVDTNRPTRVFRHFLEFEVDYAHPLSESWRLVRNWAAGLDHRYAGEYEGLQSVYTLKNGRT